MRSYLDRGYTVVKMKIGGASLDEDLRRIEAVLGVLRRRPEAAPSTPTAASTCDTAIAYAKALSQYDLFWYEEAGRSARLRAAGRRCATTTTNPMATGENLFSMQDARNLIRYGGMRPDRDWLQFDCALSYGLVEYLRTLDDAEGARLVAGALHPARRPPDVARTSPPAWASAATSRTPTCSSPSAASPTASKVEDSYVTLPDLPGIGFEGKADLFAEMRALAS